MPELGDLTGKQAASLAGLAPISRQSEKWQGKERIQSGRASVWRTVYLPAAVAVPTSVALRARLQHTCFTLQDHRVIDEFYRNPEPCSCRTV
jgi:transposase